MTENKELFDFTWKIYQAQIFFQPKTKDGQALVKPGGFLLSEKPHPTEELLVKAYTRLLEMEARNEEVDTNFLDQLVIVLDWAANSHPEENNILPRNMYSLKERRFVLGEQAKFLAGKIRETKADDWPKTLKTILRGDVWVICQNSPYNYRGKIDRLTGIEEFLIESILRENKFY